MEPTSIGITAARTGTSVARAFMGRRRPYGVVRVGSPEDRAYAYRRLLEASAYVEFAFVQYRFGSANDAWAAALHEKYVDACTELKCADFDLRLCAPFPVLLAARRLVDTAPNVEDLSRPEGKEFADTQYALIRAQEEFLEAARADLAYTPRWWQFWRRFQDWRHRRVPHGAVPIQPPALALAHHAMAKKNAESSDCDHQH